MALAQDGGSPFLGRSMAQQRAQMSGETKALIDQEVSRLVNQVPHTHQHKHMHTSTRARLVNQVAHTHQQMHTHTQAHIHM